MPPKLAGRLRSLVEQGAAILGPKPEHSRTLAGKADGDAAFRGAIDGLWGSASPDAAPRKVGAGTVFAQGSIADALAALKVAPDAQCRTRTPDGQLVWMHRALTGRSEEHTSELQVTNAHLVCRLLLEKKKTTK